LDENGAATRALYEAVLGIAGGLASAVLGVLLATVWSTWWGWVVLAMGIGVITWAIVDLIREAKKP
jgi:hypothetical protein